MQTNVVILMECWHHHQTQCLYSLIVTRNKIGVQEWEWQNDNIHIESFLVCDSSSVFYCWFCSMVALDSEQVQEQFLPLINTKQLLTGTKTNLRASLCVSGWLRGGYNGSIWSGDVRGRNVFQIEVERFKISVASSSKYEAAASNQDWLRLGWMNITRIWWKIIFHFSQHSRSICRENPFPIINECNVWSLTGKLSQSFDWHFETLRKQLSSNLKGVISNEIFLQIFHQ